MSQAELLQLLDEDVLAAAPALLGARVWSGECSGIIVETEAYRAADDPASHAYRGPTRRNAPMFGPAGHAYIYFSYGMHWMLNITSHSLNQPAGILIRAAMPDAGIEIIRERRGPKRDTELMSGPGRLAQALALGREQNGLYLFDPEAPFRVEPSPTVRPVITGCRIGISQAKELPWRFMDAKRLAWVSKPRPNP